MVVQRLQRARASERVGHVQRFLKSGLSDPEAGALPSCSNFMACMAQYWGELTGWGPFVVASSIFSDGLISQYLKENTLYFRIMYILFSLLVGSSVFPLWKGLGS